LRSHGQQNCVQIAELVVVIVVVAVGSAVIIVVVTIVTIVAALVSTLYPPNMNDVLKNRKFQRVLKNGVFWDVTPCGSCKKYQAFLRSVRRLLVTASVISSSPMLVTLMKEALSSSETSVLTRATRRPIRFLLGLFFDYEHGSGIFLRSIG
jgi:hypothetical protein